MGMVVVLLLHTAAMAPAQVAREDLLPEERDPVLAWNETALAAVKAERTPPPMAARNLAMVHAAVYDAVNAVHRTHRVYLTDARPPADASAEAAAAIAAHRVLSELYPRQSDRVDEALDCSLERIPDGPAKDAGVALGQHIAERMLAWRESDGSGGRESRYRPGSDPGRWRPTPPDFRPPLAPHWSGVKGFALKRVDQFRPAAPPRLTDAAYADAFREVKQLGAIDSPVRTAGQTEIARFWADGDGTVTPPGHWNRIAATVSRQRRLSVAENARLFALLNVAMADAAIACWDCKFRFDVWRPVTAIREADRDDNPATEPDPTWEPLLPTPPFPAYTSGHSSFSSAAAAALAEFFGTDEMRFTSTSDGLPGVSRSFTSFSSAAAEAGQSRIYGGIHWQFDNTAGLASGRELGRYVARQFLAPRRAEMTGESGGDAAILIQSRRR